MPEVSGARTHGAARWLTSDRGLIQLSIRGKWSDIFWFSFFHEAKHILDQTKRSIFLSGRNKKSFEEREADRFAGNFLIPPERAVELRSLRSLDEAQRFARSIGVHPGIVVGRLQHEKLWPHNQGKPTTTAAAIRRCRGVVTCRVRMGGWTCRRVRMVRNTTVSEGVLKAPGSPRAGAKDR